MARCPTCLDAGGHLDEITYAMCRESFWLASAEMRIMADAEAAG